MTATKTGDALEALFTTISMAAEANPDILPEPRQNDDSAARLMEAVGHNKRFLYLNIWDGEPPEEPEEALGADLGPDVVPDAFEIDHPAMIDFAVIDPDRVGRRTGFEAGLNKIIRTIAADRTLGGTCSHVRIGAPRRSGGGLITDGHPNALAAAIRVFLCFSSDYPV